MRDGSAEQAAVLDTTSPWRDEDGAAIYSARFSAAALKKLRVDGRGPRYYVVGRRILYHVADLDRWLAREPRETADTIEDAPARPKRRARRAA